MYTVVTVLDSVSHVFFSAVEHISSEDDDDVNDPDWVAAKRELGFLFSYNIYCHIACNRPNFKNMSVSYYTCYMLRINRVNF